MKTHKRQAPSRIRYERAHPTVSCRVERELYERLQATKETEGKSFADILKAGLGVLEVQARKEEDMIADAYNRGYAEAEALYKVTYPCHVCGRTMEVRSEGTKQAARQYMQEHGWGHSACRERG